MLKMIHNQLTDRLVGGADAGPENADAFDHRPSIDAIVGSGAISEAADANSQSASDRQIYSLNNATTQSNDARANDARANDALASDARADDVGEDGEENSRDLADDVADGDLQDTHARLREIRDWHLSKAQMSWSLETQQRHEDFAAWLDNALTET